MRVDNVGTTAYVLYENAGKNTEKLMFHLLSFILEWKMKQSFIPEWKMKQSVIPEWKMKQSVILEWKMKQSFILKWKREAYEF